MLGLPDGVTACLFDLDGVLTKTATVHAKAWKQMFDEFLREQLDDAAAARSGEPGRRAGGHAAGPDFVPFDAHEDYDRYVDGKPREAGVRDFLASRGIELSDDEVHHLGDIKNDLVQEVIKRDGVEAYEGSVRYLKAARDAGLRRAVVSSSHNCKDVLEAAGIADLLEARVDGNVAQERGLNGKPHPDTFLAGAEALGVAPAQAAVFEDALAGVEAGHAGNFGCVIGVNRVGQREALLEHGATVVVDDLSELL